MPAQGKGLRAVFLDWSSFHHSALGIELRLAGLTASTLTCSAISVSALRWCVTRLGVVVQIFNPGTREAEAGRSLSSCKETLSQKINKKSMWSVVLACAVKRILTKGPESGCLTLPLQVLSLPKQVLLSQNTFFFKVTFAWGRGVVVSSTRHMWRSKNNLRTSLFFFHCVGSRNWIRLSVLGQAPAVAESSVAHRALIICGYLLLSYCQCTAWWPLSLACSATLFW